MNLNLTQQQKHYLCRLAALQFPGSVANYSTRHPIHFLQEIAAGYVPMPMSEFDEDELALVEYGDDGFLSFDSLEGLVADHLCLNHQVPSDIEAYNRDAEEHGEPLFVTFKQAMETGSIPGVDDIIADVEDYLSAYQIPADKVAFFKYPESWEIKAISFTHKGAEEMRQELDNHIFRPTRYYAATTCDGDFPALMDVLFQCANEYLNAESNGITWTVNDRKTPDEVKEHFRNHPDEEMCVADYTFILPASHVLDDVAYNKATVRVLASGSMRQCGNTEYPYGKRLVMMDCAAGHKECAYPFECDALCEALEKDDNIKALFNYIHYINT